MTSSISHIETLALRSLHQLLLELIIFKLIGLLVVMSEGLGSLSLNVLLVILSLRKALVKEHWRLLKATFTHMNARKKLWHYALLGEVQMRVVTLFHVHVEAQVGLPLG